MDEYIDLYTREGRLTGRSQRRYLDPIAAGEYFLHVHILLCDTQGRYLVQKRAMNRKFAPGMWDVTGGGVAAGQDSLTTAVREAEEELGLRLEPKQVRFVGRRIKENCILDVWCARVDFALADLTRQIEEVDALDMVSFECFVELVCHNKDEVYRDLLYRSAQMLGVR